MNTVQTNKETVIRGVVKQHFLHEKTIIYVAALPNCDKVEAIISLPVTNEVQNGLVFLAQTNLVQSFVIKLAAAYSISLDTTYVSITSFETSIRFVF